MLPVRGVPPASARPWSAMAIRPAQMGEAALVPASPSQPTADAEIGRAAERAGEDVVFLGRPGVHGDVGKRAGAGGIDAGGDDAGLPGRLGLDGAQAAAAAAV